MEGEGPGFDSVFSLLGFTGFLFGFIGCRRVSLGRTELVTSVYGAQSFFITDFYWIFCGSTLISDRRRSYFINSKWFFFHSNWCGIIWFDFLYRTICQKRPFVLRRPALSISFLLALSLFIYFFIFLHFLFFIFDFILYLIFRARVGHLICISDSRQRSTCFVSDLFLLFLLPFLFRFLFRWIFLFVVVVVVVVVVTCLLQMINEQGDQSTRNPSKGLDSKEKPSYNLWKPGKNPGRPVRTLKDLAWEPRKPSKTQ